ncbi:HAMP domain-containing protein [Heliobacterium gestii]|uniref:HAMP domain-containing protein n=1 Tax=Heliomicrobium gestii TaxID=2699 RepID=A0A845LEQ3_HELGE|nr:methyl-accepting chemotaxis protein [Heliomicrobium gestii]MBM7866282.1 methyl-accepting chemotaxis protein [Heliomicrobium gestii]MZP42925.1 HAMP domain-containing protein [Heliomicrobium gestii]
MTWAKSLKIRALALASVVLICGIALAMGLMYSQAKEIITANLKQNALQSVSVHADRLAQWLQVRMAEVEVIANTEIVRTMDREKVMPYLKREMERFKGTYNSFGISDRTGKLALNNGAIIDISSESSFPAIMSNGVSVISDPFPDKQNERDLIISMETAVRSGDGTVVGLASGASLVSTVFQQNADFHIGQTDKVYILKKDGTVLYHPDYKPLSTNALKEGDAAYQSALKEMLGGAVNTLSVGDKILFGAPVQGKDWVMVLEVPVHEYLDALNTLMVRMIVLSIGVIVALIGMALYLLQSIFRRIDILAQTAEVTAKGDLRSRLSEGEDEIGMVNRCFNQMVGELRKIVTELARSATSVSENALAYRELTDDAVQTGHVVSATIHQLSQGSQATAQEVERITLSIDALNQVVGKMTSLGTTIDGVVENTRAKAEQGSLSITETVAQMDTIQEQVQKTGLVVDDLTAQSEEIAMISTTIGSIASQTNLLALNAAIEAARAGEAGQGFSVVAEEVRKLAEQSATAAKEIDVEIHAIQERIAMAVASMRENGERMIGGKEAIRKISSHFTEIEQGVRHIAHASKDLGNVAKEIDEGSKQIGNAVANCSAVSEEVAAGSEHAVSQMESQEKSLQALRSAATHLKEMAQNLETHIAHFTLSEQA